MLSQKVTIDDDFLHTSEKIIDRIIAKATGQSYMILRSVKRMHVPLAPMKIDSKDTPI